jgi:hypothetical protein
MDEFGTQVVLIVLIQLSLIGVAFVGVNIGGATALLLVAQAVFWTLGFVIRPAFLIFFQPTDRSLLADVRLALAEYGEPMTHALSLVLLGTTTYLMAIALINAVSRSRRRRPYIVDPAESTDGGLSDVGRQAVVAAGVALWVVGWLGRFATLTGSVGLLVQLVPMAVTGSVLLIVGLRRGSRHRLAVGAVLCVEILWSMSFESKAALILPVMALGLRWILQGRTAELLRALPLMAGAVLIGFFAIQSARGILTDADVAALSTAVGGSLVVGYAVGLLQRFDGFSSVTDAVYLNETVWQSTEQYFQRIGQNLVPKFGAEQLASNGQIWTREVRAYSIRDQFLDVPIAAGPTAEGYAMWGWMGIVALNAIMAIIVLLLGRLLVSRRALALVFAVSMSFNTGFFEVGMQGWAGSFNKSLQALVVAVPVVILVYLVNRSRRGNEGNPSRALGFALERPPSTEFGMRPGVRRSSR